MIERDGPKDGFENYRTLAAEGGLRRQLKGAFARGFLAGREAAATKIESMEFLLSLPDPEVGPFTNQDACRDEVIAQAATAIRALEPPKGGDAT